MGITPAMYDVLFGIRRPELLMHFDGANGSTEFKNSGTIQTTFTANGNATLSTTQAMFGLSSLGLDGTADWIQTTTGFDAFAFGLNDFTVEAWVYRTTASCAIIDYGWLSGSGGGWQLFIEGSGVLSWYRGGVSPGIVVSTSSTVTANTWVHVAAVMRSSLLTLYINGVSGGSAVNTRDYSGAGVTTAAIGAQVQSRNASYDFNGYIDEVRITKRKALYLGNFSPPNAPFSPV